MRYKGFFYYLSFVLFIFINGLLNYPYFHEENNIASHAQRIVEEPSSKIIGLNDTLSLSGYLITTIDTNLLPDSSFEDNYTKNSILDDESHINNDTTQDITTDITQGTGLNDFVDFDNESALSRNSPQMDNLSNNLVSLLSDIIIQSLETGNPTITSDPIQEEINTTNNRSTIVSGTWEMEIIEGYISNFQSGFIMITTNATDFHWHYLNNITGPHFFLGEDNSASMMGTMDFYTGDNKISKQVQIFLTLNNLELIQIIFLDKEVASHFYGFPLYGIIDSIKIKN